MPFSVKVKVEHCNSDDEIENDSVPTNPITNSSEASGKDPDKKFSDFLAILEQCTSSLNVTEDVILLDGNGDFELSELVLNSENLVEKDSYINRIQAQLDEEIMRDIEAEAKIFEAIQITNTFRENLCKEQSKELIKNNPHTLTSTQIARNDNVCKNNEETKGLRIKSKRKLQTTKKSISTNKPKFQNTDKDAGETDLESETNFKKNTFLIKKQNYQGPIFETIVDMNSKRKSKETNSYVLPKKPKIKTPNKYKYTEKGNIKVAQKPVVNTNFAKFKCNECGKEFSTKDILTDHILKCIKPKTLVNNSRLKKADTLNSLLSKMYYCDICTFKTYQKRSIETHLKMHSIRKGLSCDICEYRCARTNDLKHHMRTHTGEKPFSCNICEYRCSQKSTLKDHMRTHTGEKPFSCNSCEYRCANKSNLKAHMRTHTREKPFCCNICEFRCSQKSHLKNHIRMHMGEKRFSCNICQYRCSRNGTLKEHIRTHTGEKPFSCNICEFRFARKRTLNVHLRTHTGEKPFCCNICEYRCARSDDLKTHIRTHTGEKRFSCNICEYRCSQKSHLNNHIKTHR